MTNKKKQQPNNIPGTSSLGGSDSVNRDIPRLLGTSLLTKPKSGSGQLIAKPTVDVLKGASLLGVYFGAGWSSHSREFTPRLVEFYNKINKSSSNKKSKDLEIVYVASDENHASFEESFQKMPWVAMESNTIECAKRKKELVDIFKAFRLPKLVILEVQTGDLVTDKAWEEIFESVDDEKLLEHWKKSPKTPIREAWIGDGGMMVTVLEFLASNPIYIAAIFGIVMFTPLVHKMSQKPLSFVALFYIVRKLTVPKGDRNEPYMVYQQEES